MTFRTCVQYTLTKNEFIPLNFVLFQYKYIYSAKTVASFISAQLLLFFCLVSCSFSRLVGLHKTSEENSVISGRSTVTKRVTSS